MSNRQEHPDYMEQKQILEQLEAHINQEVNEICDKYINKTEWFNNHNLYKHWTNIIITNAEINDIQRIKKIIKILIRVRECIDANKHMCHCDECYSDGYSYISKTF